MARTEIFVLISAIVLFMYVLNQVRLRRLREEYSWIWLLAAMFYLVMAVKPDLAMTLASVVGISDATSALAFFAILFIMLILINYAVRLSRMTAQLKDLAQHIAILDGEEIELNHGDHGTEGKDSNIPNQPFLGNKPIQPITNDQK